MNLNYKSIADTKTQLTVKDIDSVQGVVEFYFAHFGSRDSDNDVILEGAYKKTIDENFKRMKHIKNHEIGSPLGKLKDVYTNTIGAVAVSQLSKATGGRDALIMYSEGIITEHSQGFITVDEQFNDMEGVNEIKEVKLFEVSSLTGWGANENTPMIAMKSLKSKQDINKAIKLMKGLDNILHNSQISDEKGSELQATFDQLAITIKSLELKPSEDTSGIIKPNENGVDWSELTTAKFNF